MLEKQIFHQHNNTVLYACAKTSYLSYYITIRMTMYRDKRAVLLASKEYESDIIYDNLLKSGVFDEVVVIDFYPGAAFIKKNPTASLIELKACITKHFDALMYSLGYSIQGFFSIVLMTDRVDYEFEIYMILKEVYYLFFEMLAGSFKTRRKRILTDEEYGAAFTALILELRSFVGLSPFSIPFHGPGMKDFSPSIGKLRLRYYINEEIKCIKPDDRAKILEAYCYTWNPPEPNYEGNSCLISMQGRAFMSTPLRQDKNYLKTFMKGAKTKHHFYEFVAQNTIDYFTDENDIIYVKSHPNNPIDKKSVKENFNSEIITLPDMPAQFYDLEPSIRDFIFDIFVEFGSNTSSMGILNKQPYPLGKDFPQCIPVINRLWFVIGMLYSVLGINELVGSYGVSSKHIKVLAQKRINTAIECSNIKNLKKNLKKSDTAKIVIIKDLESIAEIEQSVNVDIFVVLRASEVPQLPEFHTISFLITKEALKKKRYCSLAEEEFYILVKDDEIQVKLNGFSEDKILRTVGVKLNCVVKPLE